MGSLNLTYDELREVYHACHWVVIERCPPRFDLQAFLVGRLKDKHPSLAEKIARLENGQMLSLCQSVLEHQRSLA